MCTLFLEKIVDLFVIRSCSPDCGNNILNQEDQNTEKMIL
jgi:hypothetical protein